MVCHPGRLEPNLDAVLYFLSGLVLTRYRCQVHTYYISLWELAGHLYSPLGGIKHWKPWIVLIKAHQAPVPQP